MSLRSYTRKIRGGGKSPPGVAFMEICWSFFGSLVGIGTCAYLSARFFEPRDMSLMVASLGASAVLVYGAVKSPFAQPRNLVGGQVISALIGVAAYALLGNTWIAAGLAVSCALAAMLATKTLHPPGGATALLAVIGSKQLHDLGFMYALLPVGLGVIVLLVIALVVNNLSRYRRYPEYWF
jgi:CBS-domain-containing membrane protein